MKSPSVPLVASLIGIGLLGIGGYVAYRKLEDLPEEIRIAKGVLGALFHRERKEKSETPADRARMKMRQAEMKRRLLVEFPELRIEERSVPDEENGSTGSGNIRNHTNSSPGCWTSFPTV